MIFETVLIVIAVILLLIVPHELGHFFAAKRFRVRVDEFGVGLPLPIGKGRYLRLKKQFGETLYTLNALPLGGFVRIYGEEEDMRDPRSFSQQSFSRKVLIVAAGVIMNVAVAYGIFSFLAWYGTPQYAVEIASVLPGSPAESVGLRVGDVIIGLDGIKKIQLDVGEVQSYIADTKGGEAFFIIRRGKDELTITGRPRLKHPPDEGAMGITIGPKEVGVERASWYRAPLEGLKVTYSVLVLLVMGLAQFFKELFLTGSAPGEVVGPVGIAVVARESFHIGIDYLLRLVAFLSLNLAVINILPIPALDGGRILFFIIEKVKGTPIPAHASQIIHSVFLLLLIFFLMWVTYYDIARLI